MVNDYVASLCIYYTLFYHYFRVYSPDLEEKVAVGQHVVLRYPQPHASWVHCISGLHRSLLCFSLTLCGSLWPLSLQNSLLMLPSKSPHPVTDLETKSKVIKDYEVKNP